MQQENIYKIHPMRLLPRLAMLAFVPLAIAVALLAGLHLREQNRLNTLERGLAVQLVGEDAKAHAALDAQQKQQQKRGLGVLLTALMLALVASFLAAWRALIPIRELSQAVSHLGQGQPVQLKVHHGTVLEQLQQDINQAADRLQLQREEMEKELDERNRKLEEMQLDQSRFLASVSHDLRQPLYTLTLFASSLRAGEQDPIKLKRIGYIEESVRSLDHLFTELLEISRLETGTLQPVIRDFALDDIFAEVSRNFRMPAESRELRLVVRKTDAWVRSDSTMLTRILNNLVSNALRYTREGGVLVGVRHDADGRVRVDIFDTGIGIAPEHQSRIFDAFYQAHGEQDTRHEGRRGFGLGLSNVRKLADQIGCQIKLASRQSRGTRISLYLHPGQIQQIVEDTHDSHFPLDISGLRVLVVDDEPNILEGLHALLGDWGCQVQSAEDEPSALAALSGWQTPPDIVISDFHLREGRNGLDVMRTVAAHYGVDANAPPFNRILVTGETRKEHIQEAMQSQIPVLFKPVSPERLRETILAVLMAG